MKKFLVNCFIFAGLMIVLLVTCWWTFIGSGLKETYKMPADKHIVFLGNSQIEYSVDPGIVKEAVNFGLNADKPEYLYAKLKLLTKYNSQIDTVVVGMNHLFLMGQNYEIGEEILNFPDYIDSWTPKDIFVLVKHYPSVYTYEELFHVMSSMKLYGYYVSGRKGLENRTMVGTYMPLDREKLQEDLENMAKSKKNKTPINRYVCDKNIYFINKIRDICQKKGITLLFMMPPIYNIESEEKDAIIQGLKCNFPDIPCYDYTGFQLPDSCFGDRCHLNYKGAKIFSEYINKNRFCDKDSVINRKW